MLLIITQAAMVQYRHHQTIYLIVFGVLQPLQCVNLYLLSLCGSTHSCLSRSIREKSPEITVPVGKCLQFAGVGLGHTLPKPASNITRQALDWNPQGKRKVGRPKQTWRRSTDAEIKAAGTTWAELRRTSQNRVLWRGVVAALCSTRNQEA